MLVAETIESVLGQSFQDFEIILVDDCSTDGSYELLMSEYGKHEKIFIHKTDHNFGGPAAPRNFGIDVSRGIYIALLDADDLWFNSKLDVCARYISDNGSPEIIFHREKCFMGDVDNVISEDVGFFYDNLYRSLVVRGNFLSPSSAVIRRDVLDKNKFDENGLLNSVEDYELWIRLSKKYKFNFIDDFYTLYRIHGDGISKNCKKHTAALRYLYGMYLYDESKFTYFLNYIKSYVGCVVINRNV